MSEEKPISKIPESSDSQSDGTEVRALSRQQDQASSDIGTGELNNQRRGVLEEQFRTGKTRITGAGQTSDGSGGFPSGESVFGNASNQQKLRDEWKTNSPDNPRKAEILQELKDASEHGQLISDGGIVPLTALGGIASDLVQKVESKHSHPDKPAEKLSNDEIVREVFPGLYGTDRFAIPPRPESSANSNGQEKPPSDKPSKPQVSFIGGGAPPPGDDDETRKNWSDPYYDPEHGNVWNFVDKHTYKPGEQAPESPKKKDKQVDEEKENDKPKTPSISEIKDKAFRGDKDVYSEVNEKGRRKSHINDKGELEPANPEGNYKGREVTIAEHINGSFFKHAKNESPFTSFGEDGVVEKYGDKYEVTVDLKSLRADIASGKLENVSVIEHKQILKAIDDSPYPTAVKKTLRSFVQKDGEIMVKGTIPARYIKVEER